MQNQRPSGSARAAVFAPLDTVARAEIVARRLADAVMLGLLEDDEQLPSEADLAAAFGVSTVTVREALTALRQQGLVQTRRGRGGGSFVRAPSDHAATTLRERLLVLSLADLRDMADHYAAIAGAAAALAAERASPEDTRRLEYWTRSLAPGADPGAHRRSEVHFHLEVAAAAQSPRLTRQEVLMQSEIGSVFWLPLGERAGQRAAVTEHREITAAVAAGDGDAARRLVGRHVGRALERVAELRLQLVGS
jgi:GntR family transcriptional regulator, transcriptional repressor for pyruvate dehydrogenase complex